MSSWLRPRRGKFNSAKDKLNGDDKLTKGEIFFEVPDTGVGTGQGKIKMGDGVTTSYEALPYFINLDGYLKLDTTTFKVTTGTQTTIDNCLTEITNNNKLTDKMSATSKAISLIKDSLVSSLQDTTITNTKGISFSLMDYDNADRKGEEITIPSFNSSDDTNHKYGLIPKPDNNHKENKYYLSGKGEWIDSTNSIDIDKGSTYIDNSMNIILKQNNGNSDVVKTIYMKSNKKPDGTPVLLFGKSQNISPMSSDDVYCSVPINYAVNADKASYAITASNADKINQTITGFITISKSTTSEPINLESYFSGIGSQFAIIEFYSEGEIGLVYYLHFKPQEDLSSTISLLPINTINAAEIMLYSNKTIVFNNKASKMISLYYTIYVLT